MKKNILLILFIGSPLFSQWQMFSDKTDTYIYNTTTGEIYIRYRKNAKNYEDTFVKMPKGVIPNTNQKNSPMSQLSESKDDDTRLEAIKKAQDLMNNSIKGEF
ncbi:hypothetical protein [Helicobacter sp. 11S03491-1]|uniref:hypothetical protein n=1 Tax=Helicobacter sp. 11S03491-1 TaxID=1476196 RepID=UPI000BA7C7E1|nr:hypothetical protein [Helicobacter sp. 11S03491-1]PAF42253.1 hypothetical protein BKH45_04730 [Helicobacter sp. 11S03491-1]